MYMRYEISIKIFRAVFKHAVILRLSRVFIDMDTVIFKYVCVGDSSCLNTTIVYWNHWMLDQMI